METTRKYISAMNLIPENLYVSTRNFATFASLKPIIYLGSIKDLPKNIPFMVLIIKKSDINEYFMHIKVIFESTIGWIILEEGSEEELAIKKWKP